MNQADSDAVFLSGLTRSQIATDACLRWFSGSRKFDAYAPPVVARPTYDRREEFSDRGDIILVDRVTGEEHRVDVKWRDKMQFNSVPTFPHGSVIVCSAPGFERMKPEPMCFLICNADLTGALCVDVKSTRPTWFVRTIRDARYQQRLQFMLCPKHHTVWRSFSEPPA